MGLLSKVVKAAPVLPSRIYAYAAEKWGKTSWAAYAPEPIFIMTEGETGLLTLLEAGRIPETAHFPDDCKAWGALWANVQAILKEDHSYKTLVIDTSNGAERLCKQHVLQTEFKGKLFSKDGYNSFGKGDDATALTWTKFLALLDEVRAVRNMGIILLAHTRTKGVTNLDGEDYDQIRPEGIEKLWTLTHKWADAIVYGGYDTAENENGKVVSKGRYLRTTGSLATVAGNRYGLPEKIDCGSNASVAWGNFEKALIACKSKGSHLQAIAPVPQQTVKDFISIFDQTWADIVAELKRLDMSRGAFDRRIKEKYGQDVRIPQDLTEAQGQEILASLKSRETPKKEQPSQPAESVPVEERMPEQTIPTGPLVRDLPSAECDRLEAQAIARTNAKGVSWHEVTMLAGAITGQDLVGLDPKDLTKETLVKILDWLQAQTKVGLQRMLEQLKVSQS
jgi:hypothetical protein